MRAVMFSHCGRQCKYKQRAQFRWQVGWRHRCARSLSPALPTTPSPTTDPATPPNRGVEHPPDPASTPRHRDEDPATGRRTGLGPVAFPCVLAARLAAKVTSLRGRPSRNADRVTEMTLTMLSAAVVDAMTGGDGKTLRKPSITPQTAKVGLEWACCRATTKCVNGDEHA